MIPFQASFPQHPNQVRTEGESKSSAPPQVMKSNPCTPNSNNMSCFSQSQPNNPHFQIQQNNSNTHMNNGNGNFPSMQNPQFMNMANHHQHQHQHQLPMQNIQMGMPQNPFFPQNPVSQFQGQLHNNMQNQIPNGQFFPSSVPQLPNMSGGQFNFPHLPQHLNQFTGFPNGQFPQQQHFGFPQMNPFNIPQCPHNSTGCVNQGALPQGSQNVAFHMNPQSGLVGNHQIANNNQGQNMFIPPAMGQNVLQESGMNGQHLPRNAQAQMQQTQNNLQSAALGKAQGNHAKNNGSDIPNIDQRNPQRNGFTKKKQEFVKHESRNTRFQKSNIHPMTNSKGTFKGKGPNGNRARNSHLNKCTKQETTVDSPSSRSLPLNYQEEEIQKWREERRKNHPSRAKIEKKSEDQTHSDVVDNNAQKRRQELKEILAKQAELGVEVAEIPPNYLLDSGTQTNQGENDKASENGNFKKRGGRRQRYSRNRSNKKQKLANNDSTPRPAVIKKNPTLLQKLLSADINRDKSHLLQAFRFMVLNNFFRDSPKKPLEYPSVIVKETTTGTEVGKEASPHNGNGVVFATHENRTVEEDKGLHEESKSHENAEGNGAENEEMESSEGEEGEITD